MVLKNRPGFTLLEIIIVIIIVGVLASLALPKFLSTIEYAKSAEAFASLNAVRTALERCYVSFNGTYVGCSITNLSLENPSNSPGTHFTYAISSQTVSSYRIYAYRNTREGGNDADYIRLSQDANGATRMGTGKFVGIR